MKRLAPLVLVFLVILGSRTADHPGDFPDTGFEADTRAAWVTRWGYKSPDDLRRILDGLALVGINTVFFQVRGSCDALYRSSHEPWSAALSGTLGVDPGWDPLEVALSEAHRHDMELHAWINVFPAWPVSESGDPPPKTVPLHVFHAHPEWLARDASGRAMPTARGQAQHNYVFLSPTHEGAQEHIAKVVEDLIGRYEVDGLHLDYVRFPDSTYSYDSDSKAAYRMQIRLNDLVEAQLPYSVWRRQNLTEYVGRLGRAARRTRPGTTVSAAVWQIMESGREYYFQDGVEWVTLGYLDFVVPMIYTTSTETFEERLKAYSEAVEPQKVIAGLGPYLEGFTDSLLAVQLDITKRQGVKGFSIFNSDHAIKYSAVIGGYDGVKP